MKKTKKTALTAALFAAAMTMTGCPIGVPYGVYGPPEGEEPQDVYGPPNAIEETMNEETTAAETAPVTEAPTGAPDGQTESATETPPVETTVKRTEPATAPEPTIDSDSIPAPVYGPPECDPSESIIYTDPTDPTEVPPPEPLYGPPEYYE